MPRRPQMDNGRKPDGFMGMVDTYGATKDYLLNGRCVRFVAVEMADFGRIDFDDGLSTFTIDIDYWLYCQQLFKVPSWRDIRVDEWNKLEQMEEDPDARQNWYRIEIEQITPVAPNYFYKTFSDEAPKFFELRAVTPSTGPAVPGAPLVPEQQRATAALAYRSSGSRGFFFDTFHVGQGMCSLVHDERYGVLLDVGAGKPVTRAAYLKASLRNDLIGLINGLQQVDLVLSHPDSDHWRILAWDPTVRAKIGSIYVPVGARSLAFRDQAVISKIREVGDLTIPLDGYSRLDLYRSDPLHRDSNGECLVAVFSRGRERVLAAGDYVYERLLTDRNGAVSSLHGLRYAGLVVPHHGDKASANRVVNPAASRSKAFFSAGTHQGYKHPTQQAIDAHRAKLFRVIKNPKQRNIVRVNLI
jgi:beta-lactamase superfamily II metal-dependent hydrolase